MIRRQKKLETKVNAKLKSAGTKQCIGTTVNKEEKDAQIGLKTKSGSFGELAELVKKWCLQAFQTKEKQSSNSSKFTRKYMEPLRTSGLNFMNP